MLAFVHRRQSCPRGSDGPARAWQVALLSRRVVPGSGEQGPGPPQHTDPHLPSSQEHLGTGVSRSWQRVPLESLVFFCQPSVLNLVLLGTLQTCGRWHPHSVLSLAPFEYEQYF